MNVTKVTPHLILVRHGYKQQDPTPRFSIFPIAKRRYAMIEICQYCLRDDAMRRYYLSQFNTKWIGVWWVCFCTPSITWHCWLRWSAPTAWYNAVPTYSCWAQRAVQCCRISELVSTNSNFELPRGYGGHILGWNLCSTDEVTEH